ncbi:DUF2560 family protein [Providencia rettgeri]
MTTITAQNQMRLDLLRLVGNDTAAAQAAIEFVKDDELKFELFKDAYKQCQTENEFVSRAQKAAREAQEALDLFTQ